MAIAPAAPVEIMSYESEEKHIGIVYRCSCLSNVHVQVYMNGSMYIYAKHMHDSNETRYPTVNVDWVGARVHIQSTCSCNAGCRFTREDVGSGAVEATVKLPSAL